MIKIKSVDRLIAGVASLHTGLTLNEQIATVRSRLDSGVDIRGAQFAPYKDPTRKRDNSRPLQRAAMLYQGASYHTVSSSVDGFEVRATITGQAARIAFFQDRMRKFHGFSQTDCREMRDRVVEELKKGINRRA